MTLWLVRAGGAGEHERAAVTNNLVVVAWEGLPDLAAFETRAALHGLLRQVYPGARARALTTRMNQLWSIRQAIAVGDLVALPLRSRARIVFGQVTGPYVYRSDLASVGLHGRPVEWLAEVPRVAVDPDLLFAFGCYVPVARVERHDAERRVRALISGRAWPMSEAHRSGGTQLLSDTLRPVRAVPPLPRAMSVAQFEETAREMIRERIVQKFKGHRMATLVGAVLHAQGLEVRVSSPGPDGGVDILAGRGPLGFGPPRIVVQVKSQEGKVDVRVVREMAGVMARFNADYGLMVAWGGFNSAVRSEVAADYFRIRLWDGGDVIRAVQEHYAALPDCIRQDLPLKQVWTLAPVPPAEGAEPEVAPPEARSDSAKLFGLVS